jgi:hypothetical protein
MLETILTILIFLSWYLCGIATSTFLVIFSTHALNCRYICLHRGEIVTIILFGLSGPVLMAFILMAFLIVLLAGSIFYAIVWLSRFHTFSEFFSHISNIWEDIEIKIPLNCGD